MNIQIDTTLHILAIAPYEAMRTALLRAAEAFPDLRMDAYTADLQEGVEIVRRLSDEDYDAVISRGGTADLIRPETQLPVIGIPVSVYDVLRTIKLSENYTEESAVVGFPSVTESAHILCNLLRKETRIITVNDAASAQAALETLSAQGVHTVICDMVTHRIARSLGMNALLITSGESSLRQALQEAAEQAATFRRIRGENRFLRSILQMDSRQSVILNEEREIVYSFSPDVPQELIAMIRRRIPSVRDGEESLFYHQIGGVMNAVTASSFRLRGKRYYLFRDEPGQIPLRSSRPGIRACDADECERQFMNSFFSISGSLGELEQHLTPFAAADHPVMILGEGGTGKEQIARALYLRSRMRNHPFLMVDGAWLNDRGWDFLLESHSSPLSARGATVFFQRLEEAPPQRRNALLSLIDDTGLSRRLWLIFSCNTQEGKPLSDFFQQLSLRLAPLTVHMPTLRSRRDEIPALASLYLGSLNVEMGKQVSGFDPGALEMLIHYDWPGNYTQFKHVLHELAVLTNGLYVSSEDVAKLLSQERSQYRRAPAAETGLSLSGKTLTEIISSVARQAVAENGGNQTLAARQLCISRTTLWRIMSQAERFDDPT